MEKSYIIGRANISATIFVPYDCANRCNFCTTKHLYKDLPDAETLLQKIEQHIKFLSDNGVTIFTLTGGEPFADLEKCRRILSMIQRYSLFPDELKIYVNTSLPKMEGVENIIQFINDPENHIDGISVSRHRNTYDKDICLLTDIFEDNLLSLINCSVRINCIATRIIDVVAFVERFSFDPNIQINFRANYMKITQDNLHVRDEFFDKLNQAYVFHHHTECKVCNTDQFIHPETHQTINYHKGIFTTLVELDNGLTEINDFVIDPYADLYFDWIFEEQNVMTQAIFDSIYDNLSK